MRRTRIGWGNIGIASRSAPVEHRGASLIIRIVIFLILIGIIHINRIGDRQCVNVGIVSVAVHAVVTMMAVVMGKLIMKPPACIRWPETARRVAAASHRRDARWSSVYGPSAEADRRHRRRRTIDLRETC